MIPLLVFGLRLKSSTLWTPIIVRTSQDFESSDDDNDLISDILPPAEESIEDNASSDIDDPADHRHLIKMMSHHSSITLILFLRLSLLTCQVKDLEMTHLLDVVGSPRYPA